MHKTTNFANKLSVPKMYRSKNKQIVIKVRIVILFLMNTVYYVDFSYGLTKNQQDLLRNIVDQVNMQIINNFKFGLIYFQVVT